MSKKPGVWMMTLIGVLSLIVMAACVADNEDIYGYYRYGETIYNIPISSYIMTEDNADNYSITKDSITIRHPGGTKEQIAASFEKSEVNIKTFAALFIPQAGVPDISGFKQRYQYNLNEQYRLYVMDGEIWLARCPENTMWSIYRLDKVPPTPQLTDLFQSISQ